MRNTDRRYRSGSRRRLLAVLAFALLFAGSVALGQGGGDDRVSREVLIELAPGIELAPVLARYGVASIDAIPRLRLYDLLAGEQQDIDALVSAMKADPEIYRAEPHRRLDTPEGVQRSVADLDFGLTPQDFLDQIAGTAVRAQAAQSRYTGSGVVVAIVDTGFALHHPTLEGRFLTSGADFADGSGTAQSRPNGLDDDGDGLVDEGLHHGTFVAGLVNLVAPEAAILPIRALEEDGRGTAFAVAKGVLYAVDQGADVINLSLGMPDESRAVEKAIEIAADRGIIVVVSVGNQGVPVVNFPANHEESIAVAAVDDNQVPAGFTSFGPEVDLSAPGVELLSTFGQDGFARWSGTSFAAPLVAGGVALMTERYPGLTLVEMRQVLANTARPDGGGAEFSGMMGAGILDVDALTEQLTLDRSSLKTRQEQDGTVVTWSPVANAASYDVARADLAAVTVVGETVDLGPLWCIGDDLATTGAPAQDFEVPWPGEVFLYVVRDDAPDPGGQSYGLDSDGRSRIAGGSDCASAGP